MKLDVYYVDAFTSEMFSGNPAAVIFSELNDEALMQQIAAENNLSETAFVNLENNSIRWFSPVCEVNLCGHATLASAYVFFNFLNNDVESIALTSASGELKVYKQENFLQLDFPKDNFQFPTSLQSKGQSSLLFEALKPCPIYLPLWLHSEDILLHLYLWNVSKHSI